MRNFYFAASAAIFTFVVFCGCEPASSKCECSCPDPIQTKAYKDLERLHADLMAEVKDREEKVASLQAELQKRKDEPEHEEGDAVMKREISNLVREKFGTDLGTLRLRIALSNVIYYLCTNNMGYMWHIFDRAFSYGDGVDTDDKHTFLALLPKDKNSLLDYSKKIFQVVAMLPEQAQSEFANNISKVKRTLRPVLEMYPRFKKIMAHQDDWEANEGRSGWCKKSCGRLHKEYDSLDYDTMYWLRMIRNLESSGVSISLMEKLLALTEQTLGI